MRADDVRRDMRFQKRKREAVYDSVLGFIHGAILKRAEVGAVRMVYDVPLIVVGKPVVKVGDCVRHVLASLQADGYTVRLTPPKSVYISWDLDEKRRHPKMSESEIETVSATVDDFFSRGRRVPKSGSLQQIDRGARAPPSHMGKTPPPPPNANTNTAIAATATPPPLVTSPERLLPWEAFERRAQLSLLPPPQMTVTHVCEIARTPRSLLENSEAPAPPRRERLSVAKVGPNGGLVLNL